MNIETLQANAEHRLAKSKMTDADGYIATRETVAALTLARQSQSNLLASQSETRQLQLAVQQVQAESRVQQAEHTRTAVELRELRTLMENRRTDYSRDFAKAKAGKAAVVAKLREARAALQTIKDVVEGGPEVKPGSIFPTVIRAYDAVLTD